MLHLRVSRNSRAHQHSAPKQADTCVTVAATTVKERTTGGGVHQTKSPIGDLKSLRQPIPERKFNARVLHPSKDNLRVKQSSCEAALLDTCASEKVDRLTSHPKSWSISESVQSHRYEKSKERTGSERPSFAGGCVGDASRAPSGIYWLTFSTLVGMRPSQHGPLSQTNGEKADGKVAWRGKWKTRPRQRRKQCAPECL